MDALAFSSIAGAAIGLNLAYLGLARMHFNKQIDQRVDEAIKDYTDTSGKTLPRHSRSTVSVAAINEIRVIKENLPLTHWNSSSGRRYKALVLANEYDRKISVFLFSLALFTLILAGFTGVFGGNTCTDQSAIQFNCTFISQALTVHMFVLFFCIGWLCFAKTKKTVVAHATLWINTAGVLCIFFYWAVRSGKFWNDYGPMFLNRVETVYGVSGTFVSILACVVPIYLYIRGEATVQKAQGAISQGLKRLNEVRREELLQRIQSLKSPSGP